MRQCFALAFLNLNDARETLSAWARQAFKSNGPPSTRASEPNCKTVAFCTLPLGILVVFLTVILSLLTSVYDMLVAGILVGVEKV